MFLRAVAPILAAGFALWIPADPSAAGSSEQGFETALARSNTITPPAYRAFRRLEGGLIDSDRRGWLEVWTDHQPGRGMTFEVVSEGGSEYVRNKILRSMLKSEQKLITSGRRLRASLEAKNYEFADGGLTDTGLQRVVLKPAKVSDGIVKGSLWLEPASGYVTRIEGRLVKSPSFWLRDVDVTWKFVRFGGHLVPIEMTSTGRVRMFGRSNFRMTYEYASIDGRPANALSAEIRDER
jgi:hypothetical protein